MKKLISISIYLFIIFSIVGLDIREANAQFCWRGSQLPKCKIFLLFETSYHRGMNTGLPENFFLWEVGATRNFSQNNAIGASLWVGEGPEEKHLSYRIRYRRWLSERRSIGVSFGRLNLLSSPIFSGELNLNFNDSLILSVRREKQTKKFNQTNHIGNYIGIKVGSKAALYVTAIEGGAILILIIAFLSSSGGCPFGCA